MFNHSSISHSLINSPSITLYLNNRTIDCVAIVSGMRLS